MKTYDEIWNELRKIKTLNSWYGITEFTIEVAHTYADQQVKAERNKVLNEAIDKVNKLGENVDPVFQIAFYSIVNELKSLKHK